MRLGDIIRVFPRRTSLTPRDELAFVGDPPLFRPDADEVYISVTFTWDIPEGKRLVSAWSAAWDGFYRGRVRFGGPALGSRPQGFTPGLYLGNDEYRVTITSRGCPQRCAWCLVPKREKILSLIDPIPPGNIIQDNNFLACPPAHRRRVYAMLAGQRRAAIFAGGLQSSLVTEEVAGELRDIRIGCVFLAADSWAALRPLETAVRQLSFLPRRKLRCYMLCAYAGETPDDAQRRLEAAWKLGVLPFAQLYQPPERYIDYPIEWRQLQREWSRPAAMFASHKEDEQGVPYATQ